MRPIGHEHSLGVQGENRITSNLSVTKMDETEERQKNAAFFQRSAATICASLLSESVLFRALVENTDLELLMFRKTFRSNGAHTCHQS